jgi:hypothetical protein
MIALRFGCQCRYRQTEMNPLFHSYGSPIDRISYKL